MCIYLLQLSDVTLGGATVFPLINTGTNPVKVNIADDVNTHSKVVYYVS